MGQAEAASLLVTGFKESSCSRFQCWTVKTRAPSACLGAFLGADEDGVEIRREQPPGARARSQERQHKSSAAPGMGAGSLLIVKVDGTCQKGTAFRGDSGHLRRQQL